MAKRTSPIFGMVDRALLAEDESVFCTRCKRKPTIAYANSQGTILCGKCYVKLLKRSEAADLGWQRRKGAGRAELPAHYNVILWGKRYYATFEERGKVWALDKYGRYAGQVEQGRPAWPGALWEPRAFSRREYAERFVQTLATIGERLSS